MSSFFLGGVNAIAFLLCAAFLAYVACIIIPLVRHRPGRLGGSSQSLRHCPGRCER